MTASQGSLYGEGTVSGPLVICTGSGRVEVSGPHLWTAPARSYLLTCRSTLLHCRRAKGPTRAVAPSQVKGERYSP